MSENMKLHEHTMCATKNEVEHLKQELREMKEKYSTLVAMSSERDIQTSNNLDGKGHRAGNGASSSSADHFKQTASNLDVSFGEIGSYNHRFCSGDVKDPPKKPMSPICRVADISFGNNYDTLIAVRL